jgi:RNA-directed DNA polymerase
VLEQGVLHYPEAGTPQGGSASPLLSNIYLHYVLDLWFAQEVIPRLRGRAFMTRFADDVVMGFELREDAERVLRVLPKRRVLPTSQRESQFSIAYRHPY